jgi:hypothetical protein
MVAVYYRQPGNNAQGQQNSREISANSNAIIPP